MTAVLDVLQTEFGRNALLASILIALLGSVVGFFVVLRKMAFVTVGVSHAALGGVALGVLLGVSPMACALAFAVVVALGMAALGRRGVAEDTAMGVFFPAAMAFGVVVIQAAPTYQRDLLSYLFGNILTVSPGDLRTLVVVTVIVLALLALFFKELLFISFDEESAHAGGIAVAPFRTLLLVLTAVSVVVAIKALGVVLVSAMLVVPSASASLLTRRWPFMLAGSVVFGLVAMVAGLLLSFSSDNLPTGPAAVLVGAVLFGLSAVVSRLVAARRQPVEPAA